MNSKSDNKCVLAFDIGTTNMKGAILDLKNFKTLSKYTLKSKVYFPRSGYAEVSPGELWKQIVELTEKLSESRYFENIDALIFTAHMAGVLPIDKDFNPLMNILIWLDERASGYPKSVFEGLIKLSGYNFFHLIDFLRLTGGAPSKTGKDPISKMAWIKEANPEIYESTYKFLDVKGYLILKTTGSIITSCDEAHLTWLADTRSMEVRWSKRLASRYGLDTAKLPEIKKSVDIAGHLNPESADELGIRKNIPVFVGSGDLTSAAIGSGAVSNYEPHIYIGSSSWIAAHVPRRLLDIFHYMGSLMSGIPRRYIFIAEQEVAGSALDYFMELFNMGGKYEEVERLVSEVDLGSSGLIFLPWMFGERAPIDDPYARG